MSRQLQERRRAAGLPPWALLPLGTLHTLGFAPLDLWLLQGLALAGLVAWGWGQRPGRAAWGGFCFGLGGMVTGLWWLYISLHDFGGLAPVLSGLAVVLLSAYLALYPALALALWRVCAPTNTAWAVPGFAAAWLLSELARGQWLSGFPWLSTGYAHTDSPLAALAPWVGVYGIGAVWAGWAAALGLLARVRTVGALGMLAVLALGLAALHTLLPGDFTQSAGRVSVSVLQTNVPQDLKFDPDRMVANLLALKAQLHEAPADLVVTPESVVPLPRDQLDPGFWDALVAPFQAREAPRAALVGLFVGDAAGGYANSLVGVSPGAGPEYVYGKRHLLPFGEFVPPGFRWFVDLLSIPLGDQVPGRQTQAWPVAGQRVRPLICYEDLFGEDFAEGIVGPQGATVLVNATNLAWFGRWMVQDQHLQFSRMRALEFQRAMARATNTGATALIDHRGQVTGRLPPLVRARLDGVLEGRVGSTPYARWLAAWGLWPAWVVAALALLLCRRAPQTKTPRSPA